MVTEMKNAFSRLIVGLDTKKVNLEEQMSLDCTTYTEVQKGKMSEGKRTLKSCGTISNGLIFVQLEYYREEQKSMYYKQYLKR